MTFRQKLLAIALPIAGLFASCNDEGAVGLDLLPNNDGIGVFKVDTFTIKTYTIREDSLQSQRPPRFALGDVQDPVFGKSSANIAFQVLLTNENNNLGTNLSVDSLILSLNLEGYYGDTTEALLLEVFELDESIHPDSPAFTNGSPDLKPTPLASFQYLPRPTTPVPVNEPRVDNTDTTFNYAPIVRIPLDQALINRLIAASGTADLQNNTNFLNFFKGLYIRASRTGSGMGSVLHLTTASNRNGLFLYYKSDGQRRRFEMLVTNASATRNYFDFDYAGSMVAGLLGDTSSNVQETYVQAGGGVKTIIEIPYLRELVKNNDVAINKAEIQFTQVVGSGDLPYAAPTRLFILRADSLGKNSPSLILDWSEPYYGGALIDGKYTFGITRHIQRVLQTDQTDFGLVLLPNNTISSLNRVVLGSSNHPLYKPKLVVTFTKLK